MGFNKRSWETIPYYLEQHKRKLAQLLKNKIYTIFTKNLPSLRLFKKVVLK